MASHDSTRPQILGTGQIPAELCPRTPKRRVSLHVEWDTRGVIALCALALYTACVLYAGTRACAYAWHMTHDTHNVKRAIVYGKP